MIIDCISDLHGHYPKLEGADLLIVAGDLTAKDTQEELDNFDYWLSSQKYRKKVFIGGNHDNLLEAEAPKKYNLRMSDKTHERFEYLCDSGTEFEGLKIWGSPWTRRFAGMNPDATAFTVDTEEELRQKWAFIPEDVDILITHSPAFSYLDKISTGYVGSTSLRIWMRQYYLKANRIKLHVCGHIHEGYGQEGDEICPNRVNASQVNERYEPVNSPIRVIL